MPKPKKISTKHMKLEQANKKVIVVTSIAAAIVVFGLFMANALIQRQSHQARVITAKEQARDQLDQNIKAKDELVKSYQVFTASETNVLGGSTSPTDTGVNAGDNGRLILDALPSKYDFPALATSVEKLLLDGKYNLVSIEGVDDELNQLEKQAQSSPEVIEMPISFSVDVLYDLMPAMLGTFEKSIRPFKVNSILVSANESGGVLNVSVEMETYYLPEKTISITKKVVQ